MSLPASIEGIRYYLDHPVEYVEDVIGAVPTPQQRQILGALGPGARVAVRSGHGIGKTTVEAWALLWFLPLHPFARIPCTAPTFAQLNDVLWPEVAKWLSGSRLKDVLDYSNTRVWMKGYEKEWFAVARTANKPENLQGFHGDHLFFVIDEASGVRDEIMEVVEGALTNKNAMLLMAGNPTRIKGTFFDAFHGKRDNFTGFHFTAFDSPKPEEGRIYAENMAKQYGTDSDIYRVRVLGVFPAGEPDTFIRLDLAESAVDRDGVSEEGPWAIGIDPARFGDDQSVIAYRKGRRVMPLLSFPHADGPRIAGETLRIVREIRATGYEEVIPVRIDETGVGSSPIDFLKIAAVEHDLEIIPLGFGWAGNAEYADLGSLLWGRAKEMLAEVSLPRDEALIAQLVSRKYKLNHLDGKIKLERKEDMKRRRIVSPDRADAVVLCLSDVRRSAVPFAAIRSASSRDVNRLLESGASSRIKPLFER